MRQIGYIRKNIQGNRVYDVRNAGATVSSQTGGLGGSGVSLIICDELLDEKQTKRGRLMTNTTTQHKPFKYISLFAGIGGFDFGLNAVGGECVFASEIDKFAKESYAVLHGGDHLHGDITQIEAKDIPDHDVIAAGFPCQAFSVAGKRQGFEDARGTLFFEVARIAKEKRPKVLLLENVKGLVGHDKGRTLDTIIKALSDIGYRSDFQVLNSKYFGVPQNRERIFIVAVREDLVENEAWTDVLGNTVVPKGKRRIQEIDGIKTFNFAYPENDTVEFRLMDFLEDVVEDRYYLSEDKTAKLVAQLDDKIDIRTAGVNKVAGLYGKSQAGSVYDPNGISATLDTAAGGYREPIITERSHVVEGAADRTRNGEKRLELNGEEVANSITTVAHDSMAATVPTSQTSVALNINELRGELDVAHTLMARDYKGLGNQDMAGVLEDAGRPTVRIRKLTPKECWRLQGFTDAQHDLVASHGVSNSQRYKQAGNAVTVNVIQALGERLLTYI